VSGMTYVLNNCFAAKAAPTKQRKQSSDG